MVWLSLFALLSACSGSDSDDPQFAVDATAFKATIYRTEGGIPHIKAQDFGSLGFGTGYAAAQDNVCVLARNLLKYRAQLSEFLGPDDGSLDTDFFYKMLIDSGLYDEVIPLHGGEEFEGVFSKMSLDFDAANGYSDVTGSSGSWIMATEFTANGPKVKAILTYSLSANTESPLYSDMTELFSNKQFVDIPFTEEDVEAAAMGTLELTEDTGQCAGDGWQVFAQPAFASETACRDAFSKIEAQKITDFVTAQE